MNSINNMQVILHQDLGAAACAEADMKIVQMLGLVPKKDGDKWCVLWGENIQEGICGFGDTPYKAILSFNKEMNKK